jgi:ribosome-binding factor A
MTTRQERVEELIREEISDILRKKVSDPRIGFVSLTGVDVSPDFKNASVYISILGEENKKKEAMQGLFSATGFIQGELGHRLQLRVTPTIRFMRDDSIERGSRVLQIMHRIENEKRVPKNKRASKKK